MKSAFLCKEFQGEIIDVIGDEHDWKWKLETNTCHVPTKRNSNETLKFYANINCLDYKPNIILIYAIS